MTREGHEHCASLERERDQRIAELQEEIRRLTAFARGQGMVSEAADMREVAVLVVGLHERIATLTDERDEWEHRHAQVQARVEALEADLEDARYFIQKRAKVRVSLRDVWLREKARRMAVEAELASCRNAVEKMRQAWMVANNDRTALREDLRVCAETAQTLHACLLDHPLIDFDIPDEVYVPFKDALARPGVQAVLK